MGRPRLRRRRETTATQQRRERRGRAGLNDVRDELRRLERGLLAMRRLVSEQITDAVRPEAPRGRAALRERAVDVLRDRIESQCFSILARCPRTNRQERRLLGTIIRIATALERIGDVGTLMLERSVELSMAGRPRQASIVVQLMAANALDMVARSVVAFSTRDVELAATVRTFRQVVDRFGERLVHDSLQTLRDGSGTSVGPAMRLVTIAGHLEQIAGHAVGIADRVVSLVEDARREPLRFGRHSVLGTAAEKVPSLPLPRRLGRTGNRP